ncbi:hypothetical protein O4J56_00030 [Nocardiopsis sp. RSe5-2]|uniref:HEAT repeat domain-containing protein n=1 Tax=Nocardiopsis endophytica TaxID=3018445 RepID=A0ABT4TX62_9ACTN|nr:hypothetical protein [Nocardiopsis endophytica]MDA2809016.1 hypothetical protein [Nocardiopsis endophytica]
MSSSDSAENGTPQNGAPPPAELAERVRSAQATDDDLRSAFAAIDRHDIPDEAAGELINAIARASRAPELLPELSRSLRETRSPGRAILLIRALRRHGGLPGIVSDLLRISEGSDWDPERQAWAVAVSTLAQHAAATGDTALRERLGSLAKDSGLTDDDVAWVQRCLAKTEPGTGR